MYAKELEDRDAAMGLVKRHVFWGPDAAMMTEDERARVLLHAEWQVERGHAARIQNLDRWTVGYCWRLRKSEFKRAFDWARGVRNPYAR